MGYDEATLFRYLIYSLSLLIALMALFGFAVDVLDLSPPDGAVIQLGFGGPGSLPVRIVLGAWLLESTGLVALYLLAQGRCAFWWLDGMVAGWVGWIFRGPLLVVTIVTATGRSQAAWWSLTVGWWVLYTICGLALAILGRRFLPGAGPGGGGSAESHALRVDDMPSP